MAEINQGREDPAEAAARRAEWESGINDRAFVALREKRNKLLAATDFYALSDVTMSSDMASYRQDLRDLPANTDDPTNITWPEEPE